MGFIMVLSYLTVKLFLTFNIGISLASAEEKQTENTLSSYGTDWVLFPGEDGGLHFANLTFTPSSKNTVKGNVYFHLYTERNQNNYEELFIGNDTNSEYFEAENPTKFITHGWMSSGDSETVIDIKNAYLSNEDVNAIIVDWQEIADEILYVVAATSTRYVGYKVSQMVETLVGRYDVRGDQIHMIGHSLGAHVMGFAGEYIQKYNLTASRITGLDPARPLFEFPPIGGLSSSDATFVDIIHTCAGVLGYRNSHGHADFYPNGGSAPQPGCDGLEQIIEACSHARSHKLFVESINSRDLVAYPCGGYDEYEAGQCRNDSTIMGDMADDSSRGDYYLRTNPEPEYGRGADINEEGE